jgi:hypothetical protein
MIEIWKPVKGFESRYMISNQGRLKARAYVIKLKDGRIQTRKEKLIKINYDKRGYSPIGLWDNPHVRNTNIHTLVAENFIGNRPSKEYEVSHINGDPRDCRACNLAYETSSQNHRRRHQHGTMPMGEVHHATHITNEDVNYIRQAYPTRKRGDVKKWAEKLGLHYSTIWRIATDQSWQHV